MFVNFNSWVFNLSQCTSFMLIDDDGEMQIRVYYAIESNPDLMEFDTEEEAKEAFDKITNGLKNGLKYIEL